MASGPQLEHTAAAPVHSATPGSRHNGAATSARRPHDGLRGLENGASNPSFQSSRFHSLFSELDFLRQTARAISNSSGKNKSRHHSCRAEELPQGGSKPGAARAVRPLLTPPGKRSRRLLLPPPEGPHGRPAPPRRD